MGWVYVATCNVVAVRKWRVLPERCIFVMLKVRLLLAAVLTVALAVPQSAPTDPVRDLIGRVLTPGQASQFVSCS